MAYGLDGWGLFDSWGDPQSSIIVPAGTAFASSTNTVRVNLGAAVKDESPLVVGDVYNPRTWAVRRMDTDKQFTVLAVRNVEEFTYDILTLEPFGSHFTEHELSTQTLQDETGSLIGEPRAWIFVGVLESVTTPMKRRYAVRDLANAPTAVLANALSGTLQIGTDGDYKLMQGPDLVRKLVLRRIVSHPGDFYHLPNYGIGLRVKEPLPVSDLIALESEIRRQVQTEPEVEDAKVSVAQSSNVLSLRIRIKMKQSGDLIDVPIDIPFNVSL